MWKWPPGHKKGWVVRYLREKQNIYRAQFSQTLTQQWQRNTEYIVVGCLVVFFVLFLVFVWGEVLFGFFYFLSITWIYRKRHLAVTFNAERWLPIQVQVCAMSMCWANHLCLVLAAIFPSALWVKQLGWGA